MKIGLVIGHSRYIDGRRDGGAVAADGKTNEWEFNSHVARLARAALQAKGHAVNIYDANPANGYTKAMIWIGEQMKRDGIQVAAELHFNFLDGVNDNKGHGHEWLYWHTSIKGKILAQCFSDAEKRIIPAVVTRAILPRKDGRGAAFLENTYCPTVVGEPFFGDDDWDKVTPEKVAAVYVDGFICYDSKTN
jgi:hypothetical protein